tara:strand:- start:231 stop:668 length:438 start_codon:yes stop_codon:yes gene_type:complete
VPHTLRLTTLLERVYAQRPLPLEQLKRELPALDALCKSLGVSPLSSFVDISAIEWQEAASLAGAEPSTLDPDPETGGALAIEDLSWHPVALGMTSLEAISLHLQRGENLQFQTQDLDSLLQELAFCREQLAPLEAEGGQFHLAAT